ncbi:MAG: glycosyltransferase family 39 protein [Pseudomonadota bacterium]|nr:glycosyltransferase family 39 protein [Pseudomonadota bacterium]
MLIALLLRFPTFGDPDVGADEDFYLLVGQAMHHGAIPYVDIWDRKPLGLFLIYYFFAAFGLSPIAYQVGALLSVSVTAFLVNRIAGRITGRRGAILAAALYLAACTILGGIGGQAEIFCNLFVTTAFWLVLRNLAALKMGALPWEIHLAMLLLGIAIAVKQTSVVPAIVLGLFVVAMMMRSPRSRAATWRSAVLFVLTGVAPSVLIAVAYWSSGYWPQFYQAMISSNFGKGHESAGKTQGRVILLVARLSPLILLVLFSIVERFNWKTDWRNDRAGNLLLAVWLAGAVVSLCLLPYFFLQYALPAAVPLSIMSAPFLNRRDVGWIVGIIWTAVLADPGHTFDMRTIRSSEENMAIMAATMREHSPRGTALVFDGPVYLYALSGLRPLSPLVFPNHLNESIEQNVSMLNTRKELERILTSRPGVVVLSDKPGADDSVENWKIVKSYTDTRCKILTDRLIIGFTGKYKVKLFGDCAPGIT